MLSMFKSSAAAVPITVPESKAAPLVALELSRRAAFTPTNYSGLSREGFRRNPVVYRCVRLISEAAASVGLSYTGDSAPAARTLLGSASPLSPAGALTERFFGHLQIAGSAYIEATLIGDRPVALRTLRPDTVSLSANTSGIVTGWRVDGATPRTLRFDPATLRSPVMALHLFDPLDPHQGHGPLEACAQAVDIHNEGARWTKSLLDNSARPSGALVYNGPHGGERLSDAQFERLKGELEAQHSGSRSAGRPLLLEGGLDWKSMSMSPHDMDFIEARREAAREIAFAFGVPPMLLGIPGDNTYSNYREANLAFWRQTVLPLVNRYACALQGWLGPWLGEDLSIAADLDSVPALSSEREGLWARVGKAEFLTDAERREYLGLGPRAEISDA